MGTFKKGLSSIGGRKELIDKNHTKSTPLVQRTELILEQPPIPGDDILQTFTQPLQNSFCSQRTYLFQIVHVCDRQSPNDITSHYIMEFFARPVNKPNTGLPQMVGNLAKVSERERGIEIPWRERGGRGGGEGERERSALTGPKEP